MRRGRLVAELSGDELTENADPRSRIRGRRGRRDARMSVSVEPTAAAGWRGRTTWEQLRRVGILFPFLVLFAVLSLSSYSFATTTNLLNILDQQSATLIIAAAGTLVLVAGGIDLSVGATYSLAGVVVGPFRAGHEPRARDRSRRSAPAC